jgi:hypothetical protein
MWATAAMDTNAMLVVGHCVGTRDYALEGCGRFLQVLVHTLPEVMIVTSEVTEALQSQFWPEVLEFVL